MLEGQALAAYIRQAEADTQQEASISKLLGMLSRGEVKAADIRAHYKTENMPTFNSYVRSFGRGELFKAQRMNFTAWCDGRAYAEDWEVALTVKAGAEMCGLRDYNSRAMYDIWLFVCKMILIHPNQRQERLKWQGADKFRDAWSRRQTAEGWQRWTGGAA